MKFGINAGSIGPNVDAGPAREFARSAEDAGFESLWVSEHVVLPATYESPYPYDASGKIPAPSDVALPDPLIWLAYVAASTTRMRLGTSILVLPQRNPVVLAKEVATLDHLSRGRLELGVAVGWLREEFEAIGVDFTNRGKRTDEYVQAMRELWGPGAATFHGDHVDFTGVHSNPKPARGSVPFHFGGQSEVAARRAGRFGDGFMPFAFSAATPHLISVMRQEAERCGRDADQIEITTNLPDVDDAELPGALVDLAVAGVTRVLVPAYRFFGEGQEAQIKEFAARYVDGGAVDVT